jgi:hypothetical protein
MNFFIIFGYTLLPMNNLEPFDYVLGLGVLGSAVSLIPDMNEALRMLILFGTFIGVMVKAWEQIKSSQHFLNDIKALWKKVTKK